jgi:hypothetical protein
MNIIRSLYCSYGWALAIRDSLIWPGAGREWHAETSTSQQHPVDLFKGLRPDRADRLVQQYAARHCLGRQPQWAVSLNHAGAVPASPAQTDRDAHPTIAASPSIHERSPVRRKSSNIPAWTVRSWRVLGCPAVAGLPLESVFDLKVYLKQPGFTPGNIVILHTVSEVYRLRTGTSPSLPVRRWMWRGECLFGSPRATCRRCGGRIC